MVAMRIKIVRVNVLVMLHKMIVVYVMVVMQTKIVLVNVLVAPLKMIAVYVMVMVDHARFTV